MRKTLNVFRNIIIIVFAFIILLIVLSKLFEERIVNKAVEVINSQIAVPISVNKINLNLLRSFPKVNIELHTVQIESSKLLNQKGYKHVDANEFLNIDKVLLTFNLRSLLNNTFELSKIVLSNGEVNILVDKYGRNNYGIFKEGSSENSKFVIKLDGVYLRNIKVNYVNLYKNIGAYLQTNNYVARAQFFNKAYSLTTKGKVQLLRYESFDFIFVPKHPTHINGDLGFDNQTIKLNSASLITEGIQFNAIGTIDLKSPIAVDLSFSGHDVDISSVLELLSDEIEVLEGVKGEGSLEINTHIKGYFSDKVTPKIRTEFKVKNGLIGHNDTKVVLEKIAFNGSFNNYDEPNLLLSNFSFESDSSSFNGEMSIQSLKNPYFSMKTNFDIYAYDIHQLFLQSSIDSLSGFLKGSLSSSGLLPSKITIDVISDLNNYGNIHFNDFNLFINAQQIVVEKASGKFALNKGSINSINASGFLNKSQTNLTGAIDNFPGLFSESVYPIIIQGKINTNKLSYNWIQDIFTGKDTDSSSFTNVYRVNTDIKINEFAYNKILCKNVDGKLSYLNGRLGLSNLSLNAFGGSVYGQIDYFPSAGNTQTIQATLNSSSIEMDQVFVGFNNFNQKFITNENIFGKVTSSIQAEVMLVNGELNINSLDLLGHIKITDGELQNFEPALALSSFSDIDDLNNLMFNTVENDILISNGVIYIPKMEISTNVMDISLFGEQEMDGDYEYHIKLLLSDLLGKKSKGVRDRQSKFGTIEDDGLGQNSIFIVATGSNGKTDLSFDKLELRSHLKGEMKEEKREVRQALNKEFGWFKKDSTLKKKDTNKKQFEIEWDEE